MENLCRVLYASQSPSTSRFVIIHTKLRSGSSNNFVQELTIALRAPQLLTGNGTVVVQYEVRVCVKKKKK
jgi:hypothetical protein